MIVDASAVLAVLLNEADAQHYARVVTEATSCRMSAANFLEAAIVIESRGGPAAGAQLDHFIETAGIALVDVSPGPISKWHTSA